MLIERLLSAVIWPIALGMLVSFAFERLLRPAPVQVWQRPHSTAYIHAGLWLLVFCFELAVFRRPWFAAAAVSSFFLILVLVNNAKFHSLREPFIYQDFEYFTDALKHPRLYLPFLGLWRAIVAAGVFALVIYVGLTLEPSLTRQVSMTAFVLWLIALVLLALALLWRGARQPLPVIFEPAADMRQFGFLASLWAYAVAERKPMDCIADSPFMPAGHDGLYRPNLVVVQSESFFDIRRLFAGIRPDVLKTFDEIQAQAVCHGQLEVPAWGANTVRTEFAFLSGLDAVNLGVHRFNPYRKLARQGIPTLALYLRERGYRTVCVHPYPASFYARDVVYPILGFDEFIDIQQFTPIENTGPYIGDIALAEKVKTLLSITGDQPIFVFVITMENHGPLHLEQVEKNDVARLYSSPPPAMCEDLTVYLRHLHHADTMMAMLRDQLLAMPGNGVLCWYGDHVPILSKVYAALGSPDGRTDYFVWTKHPDAIQCPAKSGTVKIEHLGQLLIRLML